MSWASDVCTAFGLTSEADLKMVIFWEKSFFSQGYSPDDLAEALIGLVAGSYAPVNRPDILVKLQAFLEHSRKRRVIAENETHVSVRDFCVYCLGFGTLVVPAVKGLLTPAEHVLTGVDSGKYVAVRCKCFRGQQLAARITAGDKRMLGLAEYERSNPGWQSKLQKHEDGIKMRLEAEADAARQDRERRDRPQRARPFGQVVDQTLAVIQQRQQTADEQPTSADDTDW